MRKWQIWIRMYCSALWFVTVSVSCATLLFFSFFVPGFLANVYTWLYVLHVLPCFILRSPCSFVLAVIPPSSCSLLSWLHFQLWHFALAGLCRLEFRIITFAWTFVLCYNCLTALINVHHIFFSLRNCIQPESRSCLRLIGQFFSTPTINPTQ